jgi:predicted PurR-regulated permease PerM
LLRWGFTNIDSLFSKAAGFVLGAVVLLFALYFILRDGKSLKRQLVNLSPLPDRQDEQIFSKLNSAVHSVVWGSLAVGLIQGVLTGIGFAIFGVPSPALWGSVAVVAALVPGIGTALVLIPGVVYLFATGSAGMAIGLLIWGAIAVGLIDNFLGPLLINRGVKIHQFLILLSVLGGLSFFGPIGFIAGPLVLSLLFALLEIYKENLKSGSFS